jgi:hypothetical protein
MEIKIKAKDMATSAFTDPRPEDQRTQKMAEKSRETSKKKKFLVFLLFMWLFPAFMASGEKNTQPKQIHNLIHFQKDNLTGRLP